MGTWLEDVILSLEKLNGNAHYEDIYKEVSKVRKDMPNSWKAIIRGTIEAYSSDSKVFNGGEDIFYSVEGLGRGIWGLWSNLDKEKANDLSEPKNNRNSIIINRIIRDTKITKYLKNLHKDTCQLCGKRLKVAYNKYYSEAHHIQPLGEPHNGADIPENIIILCPECHVLFDYGYIDLNKYSQLDYFEHKIDKKYILYYRDKIQNN